MEINDYKEACLITANSNLDYHGRVANWSMGLSGETGELIDILKKHIFHGHVLDIDKVEKEIGDVMWYINVLTNELGLDMSEILEKNIAKLKARYPKGFSKDKSIHRIENK